MCRSLYGQLGRRDHKKRQILNRRNQQTLVGPPPASWPLGVLRGAGETVTCGGAGRRAGTRGASFRGVFSDVETRSCERTRKIFLRLHIGRNALNAMSGSYAPSHLRQGTLVSVPQVWEDSPGLFRAGAPNFQVKDQYWAMAC